MRVSATKVKELLQTEIWRRGCCFRGFLLLFLFLFGFLKQGLSTLPQPPECWNYRHTPAYATQRELTAYSMSEYVKMR
jgi:hypothetical protein